MDMPRRSFLRGTLVITAVAVAPRVLLAAAAAPFIPTIHGDGVTDDTAGLQAMFNGEPFRVVDEEIVQAAGGVLRGGSFLVSNTLKLSKDAVFKFYGCNFFTPPDFPPGTAIFYVGEDVECTIDTCVFNMPPKPPIQPWPDSYREFAARYELGEDV